jgi:hypothetical protein
MTDTPTPQPPPPVPNEAPKPPKRQRTPGQKWRRRIAVVLATFLLMGIAVRCAVPLLLPTVLQSVASTYGFDATYDDLDFYILGGDVGLWNLRVTPKGGGEPVLQTQYCRAAISTIGLLKGRLQVRRAEADAAVVTIERAADGSIPLLQRIQSGGLPGGSGGSNPNEKINLEPPLRIDILRLQNAEAHLRDNAVTPVVDVTMNLSTLISNIGVPDAKTQFNVQIHSAAGTPPMLGALLIDGEAYSTPNRAAAGFTVRMIDLNLHPARAYLSAFGITPQARHISFTAGGTLEAENHAAAPRADSNTTAPTAATLPAVTQPGTLSARLELKHLQLTADSQEAAAIDNVAIVATSIGGNDLRLAADVVGVHAKAQRRADGRPEFAGIAFGGVPQADAPTRNPLAPPTSQPASTTAVPVLPAVTLEALRVRDVDLTFTDNAVTGAQPLTLAIDQFNVRDFDTRAAAPATIEIRGSAPGIADAFTADGTAELVGAQRSMRVKVSATGVTPTALDPYLSPLGLRREMNNATFTAGLGATFKQDPDGGMHAGLTLSDLLLKQDERSLLNLQKVQVEDFYIGPQLRKIRLGKTRVSGPELNVTRNENDTIAAVGYVFDPGVLTRPPSTPPIASAAPTTAPSTQPSNVLIPAIEIVDFEWGNVAVKYTDAASKPPVAFALRDVRARIKDLTLDPAATSAKPGTFDLFVSSPGNFEQFSIDGSVTPALRRPGDVPKKFPGEIQNNRFLRFEVRGSATGMHFTELAPVLKSFGLQPVMKQGALSFRISGGIDESGNERSPEKPRAVEVGVLIGDVRMTDGPIEWFSLHELALSEAKYDGALNIAGFTLRDSMLKVQRDEEGRLLAAGFKLIPPERKRPATQPVPKTGSEPAPQPTSQPAAPPDTQLALDLPFVARLKNLNIVNSQIDWTDEAVDPTAHLRPRLDLSLDNVTLGADEGPGELDLTLNLPDVVKVLNLRGRFKLAPREIMANVYVRADDVSGPALAPYIPGSRLDAASGSVRAKAYVSAAPNPAGGTAARLAVSDVVIQDGRSPEPGLTMKQLAVTLDRFDLANRVIAFGEVTANGVTVDAMRDKGLLRIAGIAIGAPTPIKTKRPKVNLNPIPVELSLDELLAQTENYAPLISLDKLDLNIDRISFKGGNFAEKVALVDLKINAPERIELLGERPQRRPPFWILITGRIDKLIDSIDIRTNFAPFAYQPSIKSYVNVTGIHGDQLTTFVRRLRKYIVSSELTNGSFSMNFDSEFNYTRRGALGIDFTRDITANVSLNDIALKQAGNDKPLLGLEALRGERIRYAPAAKTLVAQSITIDTPTLQVVREKDGIHAAGFVFKLPEPPPAEKVVDPKNTAAPDPNVPPEQRPNLKPPVTADEIKDNNILNTSGGIRIESLAFSGIDLYLADRVGEPATIIPITDLDGEVRGLSTRLLEKKERLNFNVLVGSGRVELPKKKAVGGIAGAIGSAANMITGKKKADAGPQTEQRYVFAQAQASGDFSIVDPSQKAAADERSPAMRPDGYFKFSLSALELAAIRGLAAERGINLQSGTLDLRGELRMNGTRDLNAQIYPTFNDLSVTEPANGPISRFLKLPVNLDTVLFALEDANGSISLPISVPIDAGKLETSKVVGSVIGSVSRQIMSAFGAAPTKALTLGTNLIGIDFGGNKDKDLAPVQLTYAAGESQLTPDQIKQIDGLIRRLKGDSNLQVRLVHSLGSDDRVILQQRANPSAEEAGQLGYQLRQRKFELQTRRTELAAQLRVALASQDNKLAADTQAALRTASQQISATERAMDQTLDLLRPGAARHADRRTRQSSTDLGNIRLDTVRETLLASDVPNIAARIERVSPRPDPVEGQGNGAVAIVVTRQAKK